MSQYDGPSDPAQYGSPPQQQPAGSYGVPAYGRPGAPYDGSQVGMGPAGTHLDADTGLIVPDGTQVASVGRRIGAFFLAFVLTIVTLGIGYVIWGLIEWGNGRTPVQRVLGMRCYKNNEFRTFGWGDMFLREFVYWACGIVFLVQIANFIVFVANGKRQGLHDMASNCIVLHDPDKVLG